MFKQDQHAEQDGPSLQDASRFANNSEPFEFSSDDGSDASILDHQAALKTALRNTNGSPTRKKNNVVWSPEVSVSIFNNSGSGTLHAAGVQNLETGEKTTEENPLQKLSSLYHHLAHQARLLTQIYLPDNRSHDSVAVSFFAAMILPTQTDFYDLSSKKQLKKIKKVAEKLSKETFDLDALFAHIDREAAKYYPAHPFAAKLFACSLLVDAAPKINLSSYQNETTNAIMARISLNNEACALAFFKAPDLKLLQSVAEGLSNNQQIINPTLRTKIQQLSNREDYRLKPMSTLDNSAPENKTIYVKIEGELLHYQTKAADSTLRKNTLTAAELGYQKLPETLDFKQLPIDLTLDVTNAVIIKLDAIADYKKIKFMDTEVVAMRTLLEKNGHPQLSVNLRYSEIYQRYQAFDEQFPSIETAIHYLCNLNKLIRVVFESYLIEHVYALSINTTPAELLFEKINELWRIFLIQLQPIIKTPHNSTPLWQIYYLVWHHGQELLAQTDPREMTAAKLKTLYINSNKNDGQNGVAISNVLSSQLIDHLPKSFFKKDPITKVDIFKTRDELMSDLASWEMMKYPEYAYFFAAFTMLLTDALMASSIIEPMLEPAGMNYFYFTMLALAATILGIGRRQPRLVATQEISETLEIFSQKGSQLYSPSTRTETGNRDIESQHEESKDDETMSLLQTTQQMV